MTTSGSPPNTVSMSTTEGALRLWTEIVRGLQAAGYAKAVPEYLKLSRVLSQIRMTELLHGQPEAEYWNEIRRLAAEAFNCLSPLVEAAKILAELPTQIQGLHAVPPAKSPVPAEASAPAESPAEEAPAEPPTEIAPQEAAQLRDETIISDVPAKAVRKRRTLKTKTEVASKPSARQKRAAPRAKRPEGEKLKKENRRRAR